MPTDRTTYRQQLGRSLGRRFYAKSTTTGTSTTSEIVDSARTEHANEWEGAEIYFSAVTAPKTAIVTRGAGEGDGRLFLATALGSIPASGAAYELVKGWTFDDLNDGIDDAFANSWPFYFDPLDDKTTVSETTGTDLYELQESWREFTSVRRQIKNTTAPVEYEELFEGKQFRLWMGANKKLVLQTLYATETGLKLWFVGRLLPTLGSTDASAHVIPHPVIVPGALAYLYDKGVNPDEGALNDALVREAEKQRALFEQRKRRFQMFRRAVNAQRPRVTVRNDGSNVWA